MTASPSSSTRDSTNAGEQLSSSPALPTQTATSNTAGTCTPEHPSQEQQEQQQEQEEEYLFSCRCDSAKSVSSLLSCLVTSDSKKAIQPVTVFLSPTALTFHVYASSGKQSQISVDLNKSLFCDFQVTTGEFSVNLTSVLDCIHVLGNNHHLEKTKLSWAYSPLLQTLEMELLEEGGVLSTAAIPGLLPPLNNASSLALAFKQSPVVSRILLKSEWLKQAWNELEHVVGATTCTVQVSSQALQLATVGHNGGECIVSLPANTPSTQGLLLSLETTTTTTNNSMPVSYPWLSFKLGMKGLDIAEETCLTMNQDGIMAIQHRILLDQDEEEHANFCDFLMASLTHNTEEEEEDGSTTTTVPPPPPPLSLGWKSQEEHEKESDCEDEEQEEQSPPISAAPLFASVVDEDASMSTNTTTTRQVVQRRRRRQSRHGTAPSSSVASSAVNPHDESSSSSSSSSSDDEEKMSATPQRQQRRRRGRGRLDDQRRRRQRQVPQDGSSSPEIEYGNDSD